MRKYIKPLVKVVDLKSSKDIAASFETYRRTYIQQYLTGEAQKSYSVSAYADTVSGQEIPGTPSAS